MYFWRDQGGLEIDLIMDKGLDRKVIEIKSSQTYHPDFLQNLQRWQKISLATADQCQLIYAGTEQFMQQGILVTDWQQL